ncbi:MAG: hypothetical protein IPM63_16950 [Acidobacteriota bacterium]|nr:MAG: hypothetical protein IPM63_16950 [Acidobacteriota bacterium]
MSISLSVVRWLSAVPVILFLAAALWAQSAPARATVKWEGGQKARIEGSFPDATRAFSFTDAVAGVEGLSERISDLKTFSADGSEIPHRRGPLGAVFADEPVASYSYVADLSPQSDVTLGAHLSWISAGKGILLLRDLIPSAGPETFGVRVRLDLPEGVTAFTNEPKLPNGELAVEAASDAVFLIAPNVRRLGARVGGTELDLAIEGEWQFGDSQALEMSKTIFRHYEDIFDSEPSKKIQILLVRAPEEGMRDRWRAETRGNTLVIVSSPSTYRNHGEQRFHEQLRHELLHLWIPNSMNLTGDYAWFYEGFVFYRALVAGAELEQITFGDVLITLADIKRRSDLAGEWKALTGPETDGRSRSTFYSRGTLAAFAADTALISGSNGKRDLDDVLKRIYRNGRRLEKAGPANDFLVRELSNWTELKQLINSSINGKTAPDWGRALGLAGLSETGGGRLAAVDDPDSSQRAFLERLGYNVGR